MARANHPRLVEPAITWLLIVLLTGSCANEAGGPNEPEGPPIQIPRGDVWFQEDFASYSSTEQWLEDPLHHANGEPAWDEPRDRWRGHFAIRQVPFELDGIRRVPDAPGFNRVLEFEQPAYVCKNTPRPDGEGPASAGYHIWRDLILPEPVQEVWAEFYVRFSSNYKTDFKEECDGGSANPDHKFIFFQRANPNCGSRWQFKVGTFGSAYTLSNASCDPLGQTMERSGHGDLPNECFNDVWQRWRFHAKLATAEGRSDGFFEWRRVEIDDPDQIVIDRCGRNAGSPYRIRVEPVAETHPEGFAELQLGRTFNEGPVGQSQYYWWGPIRVWNSDPGWGW